MICLLWSHARLQFDSTGLPSLSISVLFYIHCSSNIEALSTPPSALQFEGLRLTFLVTGQAGPSPHTFRVLGDSKPVPRPLRGQRQRLIETVRLPTLSACRMLYMLWRHARLQIYSIGLPTWNMSIVFYTLWKHARLHADSIGLPTLHAFYVVLLALEPYQGTVCAPLGCPH